MDQKALAQAAGVAQSSISRIERREILAPRMSDLRQMAEALGVSLAALIEWSDDAAQRAEGLARSLVEGEEDSRNTWDAVGPEAAVALLSATALLSSPRRA